MAAWRHRHGWPGGPRHRPGRRHHPDGYWPSTTPTSPATPTTGRDRRCGAGGRRARHAHAAHGGPSLKGQSLIVPTAAARTLPTATWPDRPRGSVSGAAFTPSSCPWPDARPAGFPAPGLRRDFRSNP